jgi:tRNA (Thr-GGU) A37 N-methylase
MNETYQVKPIGRIITINDKNIIKLDSNYLTGLTEINGFSHLQVIWWAHLTDQKQHREVKIVKNLFKNAPENIGIFSTRAPARPNPIMISTIKVDGIDNEKGLIYTSFIDAESGTPILDIKPYFPMERVKNCRVPGYFEHWPEWAEDSASFNWQNEINFN